MDDTENNSGNYKTLKTSTETILKNSEMLEFVPDQLTTKRCVKLQLKTWGL